MKKSLMDQSASLIILEMLALGLSTGVGVRFFQSKTVICDNKTQKLESPAHNADSANRHHKTHDRAHIESPK